MIVVGFHRCALLFCEHGLGEGVLLGAEGFLLSLVSQRGDAAVFVHVAGGSGFEGGAGGAGVDAETGAALRGEGEEGGGGEGPREGAEGAPEGGEEL